MLHNSITYFQGTHIRKIHTATKNVALAIKLLRACGYDVIKVS